jgi:serine/threonine protein kinase
LGDRTDEKLYGKLTHADTARLPSPPDGVSRVDTLPEAFISSISRRPQMIGDVVGGRYKLVESLGDGAMGQVFVAENQAMGWRVAIKLLKPDLLADASFRKRFQLEAMAIAAIEHRNVARFIDLVVGDPTFLVMEFVAGPTLAAVLKREKRIDPTRATNLVKRLCWALDSVHRAGVVHRDIKPANVILAPDPELGEEPKLIDFGLAKLAFAKPEEQLTRAGQFVGTPHYMSPEQIASRDVDARSDVYSLGCLLYHLVAGRPPFGGTDDVQVLYKQIEQDPEPVRNLVPDVPLELEMVLRCALAKEPGQRFATMRDMAEALGKVDRRKSPPVGSTTAPQPSINDARPPRSALRQGLLPMLLVVVTAAASSAVTMTLRSARPARGLLVVTSLPSGARVQIDGRALADPTPAALTGLSAGEHRLHLEVPGRMAVDRTVKLTDGERTSLDVVLPSTSRAVEVKSIPEGATVFLDGVHVPGETPLTLSVADDDFHELRLEKLGYEPETEGLKPEESGPVVVSLQAEKQPRGLLWVDSSSGGEVFVDGKDTGYSVPTVGIRVSAGAHVVELRDSNGARSAPTPVTIRSGESVHVTPLVPGGGAQPR